MEHRTLSDDTLLSRAQAVAADARRTTVELLELLVEIEDRQLHLAQGHSTLFAFCTPALNLSEGEAGKRLMAARASRRFPVVLELLRSGELNLTSVRLLAPHLTDANHVGVLRSACGKGRRQVEEIVVGLAPKPIPAPTLQRVAAPAPVMTLKMEPAVAVPRPATVVPLAPAVYRLSATMTAETRAQWQRLRELAPGDDAALLARAVAIAVQHLEKQRLAATERPHAARPTGEHSRHIPAEVKREVTKRDEGRCAFISRDGHRCDERRWLEFHHVRNWMTGGPTTVDNIQLRCRPHNQHEASRDYGPLREAMFQNMELRDPRASAGSGASATR